MMHSKGICFTLSWQLSLPFSALFGHALVFTWIKTDIPSAVVAGLIHVNPDPIQWQHLVKVPDLVLPPGLSPLCKEVWKVYSTRP